MLSGKKLSISSENFPVNTAYGLKIYQKLSILFVLHAPFLPVVEMQIIYKNAVKKLEFVILKIHFLFFEC